MLYTDHLSAEQLAALMVSVIECSKCRRKLQGKDFAVASMRGRHALRTWCRDCLSAYYREYSKRRRK